jgi:hypothetical protein
MSNAKGIKICQYDIERKLINTFISISDASRKTGIPKSSIILALNKNNSTKGYYWNKFLQ